MLRSNFLSRIKKVCSASFVPRILRGDQRFAAAKFEILSCAAVRRSPKSTKATDGEGVHETTKDVDKVNIVQTTKEPLQESANAENTKENMEPLVNAQKVQLQDPQYEKCRRIIEQAFGKDEAEVESTELYFTHDVDAEQTKQGIEMKEKLNLAENSMDVKAQSALKYSPELKDEPEELIEKEDMVKDCMVRLEPKTLDTEPDEDLILIKPTLNLHLLSARAPDDLMKDTDNNMETTNENLHLEERPAEDLNKYVHSHENLESLYGTHEEPTKTAAYTIDVSETRKEQEEPPVINKYTGLESEANVSMLKNTYFPNEADMDIQPLLRHNAPTKTAPNTIDVSEIGKEQDETPIINKHSSNESEPPIINKHSNLESETNMLKQLYLPSATDTDIQPLLRHNAFVNATTAKEEQEKLKQKVEDIQETPLVEVQNEPIEGFNVTPRVLGDLEQAYSCVKEDRADSMSGGKSSGVESSIDEAAKRCLDSPFGQIDEALLNELEKLGIPTTCKSDQKRSPFIDDNRVQMNILYSYSKLDPFEDDETSILFSEKLYPGHPMIKEIILPDKDAEAQEIAAKLAAENEEEDSLAMYPSHMHIDKNYDLKTLMTKLRSDSIFPEAKPQEVIKQHDIKIQQTPQALHFNPAQISSISEGTTTDVNTEIPPKQATFQAINVNVKETEINEVSDNNEPNEKLKTQQFYARPGIEEAEELASEEEPPVTRPNCKNVTQTDMSVEIQEIDNVSKSVANYMAPPPLQRPNKINSNVSDGIWDENIDALTSKEKRTPPEELTKPQTKLDPCCVFSCSETCPISPNSTPSHLIESTEAIFENQLKNPEQKVGKNQDLFIDVNIPAQSSAKQTLSHALSNLPKLDEDNISMSELLRRVRERSKIIEYTSRNELKSIALDVDPIQAQVGKCPKKAPHCLPTAPRPPKDPIPPPPFGLPQLKPQPPACKPRKPRTRKYSTCDLDLSSGLRLGPEFNAPVAEVHAEMIHEMKNMGTDMCAIRLKADLTEQVIERLETLGKLLGRLLGQRKEDWITESRNRPGSIKTMLARDYAPWVPIPSWPAPKQATKRKPPCEPGCPIRPLPLGKMNPEPPCNLKPCKGFPKKSFSIIDGFVVSENKVYDIGKF
ncbi:hypothetical protein HW555_003910 [Spodoptera exigua]|uniref:Uncharacterized protein n=1 Tax=Spodoptera exigua TaxID=7107 RepID=A0A835L818_SPOEX|nr:hypothetical protein HW555_003910 [Spodoptera exigua]